MIYSYHLPRVLTSGAKRGPAGAGLHRLRCLRPAR